MSAIIIRPGDLVTKDPADEKTYVVDWDGDNLPALVTLTTSTWTITPIGPSTSDVALTKDSEALLSAADATLALERTVALGNRVSRVRLKAGTLGQTYEIANKGVTSETPSQTKERSFRVLIQNG